MTDLQLYTKISSMPDELKKEVSDFVKFLEQMSKSKTKLKERKFGYAEGFFKMSPDFDEPLEDLKNYM